MVAGQVHLIKLACPEDYIVCGLFIISNSFIIMILFIGASSSFEYVNNSNGHNSDTGHLIPVGGVLIGSGKHN